MAWYTMTIQTEKGKGDYESENLCIFDQKAPSDTLAIAWAVGYSQGHNGVTVDIFKGKNLGKFFKRVYVNV